MKAWIIKQTLYICLMLMSTFSLSQDKKELAVVLQKPGMDMTNLKAGISYKDDGDSSLLMDIYYPNDFDFNTSIPVVLIVYGYSSAAQNKIIGKPFMKWQWYTSWCRLLTTYKMAAIVYETTSPTSDLSDIQQYISTNASKLNLDAERVALFSVSGNSAIAMDALLNAKNDQLKCGVFLYPYVLTEDSSFKEIASEVADQSGFTLTQLPDKSNWNRSRPIFLVQAGLDKINGIKETTGEFIKAAHASNLPLTFVNYHDGIHGFDARQDTPSTKDILEDVMDFLAKNLGQN